jgi:thiamine pyrophosphate-dependent acetolactate synthase large subunit-like protein
MSLLLTCLPGSDGRNVYGRRIRAGDSKATVRDSSRRRWYPSPRMRRAQCQRWESAGSHLCWSLPNHARGGNERVPDGIHPLATRHPWQIVAQYCRYSAEIRTGKNIKQVVNRALQFACSEPAGPVYLWEQEKSRKTRSARTCSSRSTGAPLNQARFRARQSRPPVRHSRALANIITGYSGRNLETPAKLVKLADTIRGLQVQDTIGSDMYFPADHRGWLGVRYGVHDCIPAADVILVIDCDIPWIPTRCKPSPSAQIFHIDSDPLKQLMPLYYLAAVARYRAESFTTLSKLNASTKWRSS